MKYYSIRRPILPGGYPEKELVERIVNFDTRIYCQEIDGMAWDYVEYKKELTPNQADAYELVLERKRKYWCAATVYDSYGRITAKIIKSSEAFRRSLNMFKRTKRKKICREWFDSREEAEGLSQQDIGRIYDTQRRAYWEADFVNQCIDRNEARIGLCNLLYESLADEKEILDKAYSLYEKAEDGSVPYLDTLDRLNGGMKQTLKSIDRENNLPGGSCLFDFIGKIEKVPKYIKGYWK